MASLGDEHKRELLRELWDEFGGPNDRTTMEQLNVGTGLTPEDIARMIAAGWDEWGSQFLMSVMQRVGSDPADILQSLMRELAPRKAAATEAVVAMADGIANQLGDATRAVQDTFSASWASGAAMGRDLKEGLNGLKTVVSELEAKNSSDSGSAMKL